MTATRDEAACREIYLQHFDFLLRVVSRFLRNRADAEEVVQRSFINIFKHMEDFRSEAELSTWMYRIAVNTALTYLREQGRKKRLKEAVTTFAPPPAETPGALEALQAAEIRKRLWESVDRLDEKKRAVIVLHDGEDMKLAEIAKVLQIPLPTVASRLMAARKELLGMLKDDEHFKEHL